MKQLELVDIDKLFQSFLELRVYHARYGLA